jgi:glutamine amidotransferase
VIAVIDYKAGNLTSVLKSLRAAGEGIPDSATLQVTEDPDVVRRATRIILPGVGHFAATLHLHTRGLAEAVRERTVAGVPFLGICVGLQWLFSGSTEAPETPGFGAFAGSCTRFDDSALKCPHVGWNSLRIPAPTALTTGLREDEYVYFTHSYRAPLVRETTGICNYGSDFTAIAERDNIMGVQFHPEKSGAAGLRLLANFMRL